MRGCAPLLHDIIADSNYYPVGIDTVKRTITFAYAERAVYKSAAFLGPPWALSGAKQYRFNLDDVLLIYMGDLGASAAPIHYIYISAYCCSTLLARYLDESSRCLVIKEPPIISQLAFVRYGPQSLPSREWMLLVRVCLRLLRRSAESSEAVIIKCSDLANCIVDPLLELDDRSKAVVLSISLRTFLLSVLKSKARRDWTRKRARDWQSRISLFPLLSQLDLVPLTDAQKGAYIWLMNNLFWSKMIDVYDCHRVVYLDGDSVSRTPKVALERVLNQFGLDSNPAVISSVISRGSPGHHSKISTQEFGHVARIQELELLERQLVAEVDHAIEWATAIAERLGFTDISGPYLKIYDEEA